MYPSYADNIPLTKTSTAYTSVAAEEADPWRLDATLLHHGQTWDHRTGSWWQRVGWPIGALGAAAMATTALLINLTVLIWVSSSFNFDRGIARVFAGECHRAETINTWVHFGINALSTMLLSGSNYCMQILSAPTRKEVDKAHARRRWLDIGVPSVRNLKNVATKKLVMWVLLGFSSLPLHFLYNSVIYYSIATNEYDIVFASEAFVQGGPQASYNETQFPQAKDIQIQAKTWDRLEPAECINAYATEFLNTRRNLVAVVVDNTTAENDTVKQIEQYRYTLTGFYDWICDTDDGDDGVSRYGYTAEEAPPQNRCSAVVSKVKANADRWRPLGWDIDYCLSEQVPGNCDLNFSLTIMIVVIFCNVSKALIMLFIAFRLRDKPLITIGDAIDSFLNDTDQKTKRMCLSSKSSIKANEVPDFSLGAGETYADAYIRFLAVQRSSEWRAGPVPYKSKVKRWFRATSVARWTSCLCLFFSCMITVAVLLAFGIASANSSNGIPYSAKGFLDLGIGAVNPNTIISGLALSSIGGTTLISSVLIANIPQPILSFLYLLFNGVFTSMLLADEWSHFAYERKPLRVSDPKPGQRSTYFLQLPYRYAVPLLILSGILHWSVSQSIFLAQVASFDKYGNLVDPAAISTCGYSPSAIALTMIIGVCLTLFMVLLSLRRFRRGIPLAGSCSAAISAACHGRSDIDTTLPLQWGVISEEMEEIGHCAFSDKAVEMPVEGKFYAGDKKEN